MAVAEGLDADDITDKILDEGKVNALRTPLPPVFGGGGEVKPLCTPLPPVGGR